MPTFLVMFRAGGMSSTLLLPLTPCFCSWLFRSDSWVFGLFVSCYPQYVPTAQAQSYFWFLIISLYFLAQKGLRSRVPGCLSSFKCLQAVLRYHSSKILFSQQLPTTPPACASCELETLLLLQQLPSIFFCFSCF